VSMLDDSVLARARCDCHRMFISCWIASVTLNDSCKFERKHTSFVEPDTRCRSIGSGSSISCAFDNQLFTRPLVRKSDWIGLMKHRRIRLLFRQDSTSWGCGGRKADEAARETINLVQCFTPAKLRKLK
jgi:hypothetical protein